MSRNICFCLCLKIDMFLCFCDSISDCVYVKLVDGLCVLKVFGVYCVRLNVRSECLRLLKVVCM